MSLLKPGAAVFVIALKKPDGTVNRQRLRAELAPDPAHR